MKQTIHHHARIVWGIAIAAVVSQAASALAGWTGNVNGTGYGWAQSSVTSATSNSAVALTATNVSTKNPSAAISPATGYIATASLPKGASTSTYSKTLTGTGYRLQNATVAAGGDRTDDPLLSTTGSQSVSGTFLQITGVNISPDPYGGSDYTFNFNTVGTDSGAAQLLRVLDLSRLANYGYYFNPTNDVIVAGPDPSQLYWNSVFFCGDCGGYITNHFHVSISDVLVPIGEGVYSYQPSNYGEGGFFNSWGGWSLGDSFTAYGASSDPNYVFLDYHGTAASVPNGPGDSMIAANFNGTAIASNSVIWFNSILKPKLPGNLPANTPVTIAFVNQIITGLNGQPPVSIPDTYITLDPSATCASTSFDGWEWNTTAPQSGLSGNLFLSGVALPLPAGLPGGNQHVTWSGTFVCLTPGVQLQWAWSAAAYNLFASDLTTVTVKATDDNKKDCNFPGSSDHAGTPENCKQWVTGGAGGGGGANYTGGLSGTANLTPTNAVPFNP